MFLPTLMVVAVLVASAILVRRMAPSPEVPTGRARWVLRLGIVVLALNALFWAAMGIGEMAGEISGGEGHLFPATAAAFLAFLSWRRPNVAAIVSLLLGTAVMLFFVWIFLSGGRPPVWWNIPLRISLLGGPFLLAGFLLWLATGGGTRRPHEGFA